MKPQPTTALLATFLAALPLCFSPARATPTSPQVPAEAPAQAPLPPTPALAPASALLAAMNVLKSHRFVDLTHAFSPSIPHWKGDPVEVRRDAYTIAKDGFWLQEYTHVGQWGTHVDPPAHFHEGLRTVDQIRPDEMLLPLVVLDIHRQAAANPDYVVTLQEVRQWETRHGRIPAGAFIALRTDWSKRWPNGEAMANKGKDGLDHYPGWSREVLQFLFEERGATACGHETTDTDPGLATSHDDYSLESYVLGRDRYQIELLTNLDQVPEYGAVAMVTFPKPENGSGFPARVIAIVP